MSPKPKPAEFDNSKVSDLCGLLYVELLPDVDVKTIREKNGAKADDIFRSRGECYARIVRATLRTLKWIGTDVSAFDPAKDAS